MLFKVFQGVLITICLGLSFIGPYLIMHKMDLDYYLESMVRLRYDKNKFNEHINQIYKIIHFIMITCFVMGVITSLLFVWVVI